MGSRYQELYRFHGSYYGQNCPVLIETGALQKDTLTNTVVAQLKLLNISEKQVFACKVVVWAFEANGTPIEGCTEFQYLDLKASQGEYFGTKSPILMPSNITRNIKVCVTEVVFSDTTVWVGNAVEWKELFPLQPIEDLITDHELIKQYHIEAGANSTYAPEAKDGLWMCTCGSRNLMNATHCYKCKRRYEDLMNFLNFDYLQEKATERINKELEAQRERERRRLAREKEQREAEERLRKAQEEKERQEREEKEAKNAKKKKIIKRTIISIVSVILLVAIGYGTIFHLVPLIRYNTAASKVEKLDFDSAYNTYIALKDYKDSADKATETLYKKATYLEGQEQFVEAAVEYEKIPTYQDSKTKAIYCRNEANYRDAKSKFDSKDYAGALTAFKNLGDYSDSKEWINKTNYEIAKSNFEGGDYSKAFDQFTALGDYEDSKTQANESKYMMAETAFETKDYQTAYEYYSALGKNYKDCEDKALESQYLYAGDCMTQKKYKEASDTYGILRIKKEYEDSADKYIEASYLYAKSCYESKNYADAVLYFARAGAYEDSLDLLKDSKYENALKLINSREYKKAVNILKDLDNYKESKTKLNEAKYAYVKAHKDNTDTTTYSYLKDLKAARYSDSKTIYNELYAWKATIVANSSTTNSTSDNTRLSKWGDIIFHVSLSGGEPGGSTHVKYKIVGSRTWWLDDGTCCKGSLGYFGWYDGADYNSTGTLTVYVYDGNSNQIGKKSVTIY